MKPLTLRQQVQDILRKEIRETHKPGDLLPGERRLAERFGVSIMTVREALQGLADLQVVERQQGVGTTVLDPRGKNRDLPIGILVEIDVTHPNTSPHYLTLALGLKRELETQGHQTQIFFGTLQPGERGADPTSKEVRRAYREESIKALVVLSWTTPAWRINFESVGIPVIRFGNDCPCGVRSDHSSMVVNAVQDMVQSGCRKLALLTWEGHHNERAHELSDLFKLQINKMGLKTNERWISAGVAPSLLGAGWEGFREIWLANEERPDGILISDSVLLRGALQAVHELRIRVPDELIIGTLSMAQAGLWGAIPIIDYEIPLNRVISLLADLAEDRLKTAVVENRLITVEPVRKIVEPLRLKQQRISAPIGEAAKY